MMVTGPTTSATVKVHFSTQVGQLILEAFQMDLKMGSVFMTGTMGQNMKVTTKKTKNMAKENTPSQMGMLMRYNQNELHLSLIGVHQDSNFQGGFQDDRFHGNGTYEWASGAKYVGQHVLDERTGNSQK